MSSTPQCTKRKRTRAQLDQQNAKRREHRSTVPRTNRSKALDAHKQRMCAARVKQRESETVEQCAARKARVKSRKQEQRLSFSSARKARVKRNAKPHMRARSRRSARSKRSTKRNVCATLRNRRRSMPHWADIAPLIPHVQQRNAWKRFGSQVRW